MRSVKEAYRGSRTRVFLLDRAAVLARLQEAAARLLERHPEVLEVRLFGSLARGDARPGSDADLLIVVRDSTLPFLERSRPYAQGFSQVGVGCDLLVYTDAERRRLKDEGNSLLEAAEREGRSLALRGEARSALG